MSTDEKTTRAKPSIPDVIDLFKAYHVGPGNSVWGSLHVVLEDGNFEDDHVRHCVQWATERGDVEGEALARILLTMSKTQRKKIGALA